MAQIIDKILEQDTKYSISPFLSFDYDVIHLIRKQEHAKYPSQFADP